MSGVKKRFVAASSAGAALALSGLHPDGMLPTPRTWPISTEVRSRVSIRWPAKYEWAGAGRWVDGLRFSLAAQMRLRTVEIEQPYEGMVLFEVELDGETHEVGIDYFDKDRLLDEVVGRCPFVFKMQHLVDGYGLQNVVPGAAMEALQNQGDFRYEGSLQVVPYAAYLREAALSRVCIDLPGNGDMCHPWSII